MNDEEVKRIIEKTQTLGLNSDKDASSYILANDEVLLEKNQDEGLEILDIRNALKKYDWLKDYMFKLIDANKDEFTKSAYDNLGGGYFIRIKKGAKVNIPINSCLLISKKDFVQRVHNIIIAEEGSTANILTGCMQEHNMEPYTHIGLSEFFIEKGASLNFTMIHNWGNMTKVRPRTKAVVKEGGSFVSNYILLQPVKDIQAYPIVDLKGADSKAVLTSLINGTSDSLIDIGSGINLLADNTRGEVISRVITQDESTVISRSMIHGQNETSKAHLECRGLILSNKSRIHAVPELIASANGTDLSHEAAVGKIADKELQYLMARGLDKDQSTSVIVRGFLDTNIMGLPTEFKEKVDEMMDLVHDGM
ncbi:SufD family Fe-S cluster assembly protein [Candidatus Woesearchaeota archaeon]|nr:SufD family Fe-S cluster assembly protein [Candidatus Woesearchaeota archaeon]